MGRPCVEFMGRLSCIFSSKTHANVRGYLLGECGIHGKIELDLLKQNPCECTGIFAWSMWSEADKNTHNQFLT
ncbi:hypothetical protein Tco_0263970, partial [Tanacetum coccineum]